MATRQKKVDPMSLVAQGAGILILIGILVLPKLGVSFSLNRLIPIIGVTVGLLLVVAASALLVQVWIQRSRTTRPGQAARPGSLIDQLRAIDWFQFEKVIEAVYTKLGYQVTRRGGANPDGGIDLILDRSGDRTAVQCKHWKNADVGVRVVREFLGAMTDAEIKQGTIVTLCGFTPDARLLADRHCIRILGETDLEELLTRAHAGEDPKVISFLQDTRKYCPKCEREMVLRTGKGEKQFWGCSAYPKCRFTMPAD